jgi:hypothetical protein
MDSGSGKAQTNVVGLKGRKLPCWIESFTKTFHDIPSPEIFRKWAAISSIGAALERRVVLTGTGSEVYANLFILLVAPPGVGKTQAIAKAVELWHKTGKMKVAPDDITKASLLDHMAECEQTWQPSPIELPIHYHSLNVAADEFGVLCPAHDLSFMSVMNALYDNRALYKESRRGRNGDLVMANPQLSILAGTQPDFMSSLLPPEAWGMGFMSRMVMVYCGTPVKVDLFKTLKKAETRNLELDLRTICELRGVMQFSEEAQAALVTWYANDLAPAPTHSKLKHYKPRRILTVLKLCMISSAARKNDLIIDETDVERARDWLLEAEALMPDVFKDMSGAGDAQIIRDLHYFCWELYVKEGKKPIHRSRVETFLLNRTPSYNIPNILNTCDRAGILKSHHDGEFWVPGTTNDTGEVG